MKKEKTDLGQLLSKLLNDLLRMGWKPFNRDKTLHIDCYDKCKGLNYKWIHLDGGFMNEESRTLRELVSIESRLWQFVCKNKLYNWQVFVWLTNTEGFHDEFGDSDYQFRLIESALCDEDKLEEFLLNSIKLD